MKKIITVNMDLVKIIHANEIPEILGTLSGDYVYDSKKLAKLGYKCDKEVYLDAYYIYYVPESKS